jgi:Histidine phosphatase superfamily (branch 1)
MAVGRLLQTFFTLSVVLLALIFVLAGQECLAFALSRSAAAKRGTQRQRLPKISAEKVNFRGENACLMAQQHNSDASYTVKSRRELMKESSIVAATALSAPCWVSPAHAISFKEVSPVRSKLSAPNPDRIVNLECLQDLPPLPNDSIRIYLCRHGQTENNRLRRVQGARVDPPINGNGRIQATNLGQALIMAQHPPTLWLASPLTRAQQTAKIGSEQMAKARPSSIATLQSLREVDFGPLSDGEPIQKVQEQIIKAYATWSFGNIDYQPPGGGDSGREVRFSSSTEKG